MNFKIVEYHCGCRHVFTDAMPRSGICPEHRISQKMVTLWCETCEIKVEVIPLAGRRKRCMSCSEYKTKSDCKAWAQRKYNKKHGIEDEATPETLKEKEERLFKEWCSRHFKLPVVETPILDRWLK